ncbi:hippurate hydrolase [Burkholderia sp. WP9]|jgi:hippurate hydrolase|uniref:M20 aminoacylase family protein n=2 Tax=Burkholderiaceae TaxID=119060 RepID=UPI00089A6991|nr:hippurate hydrolase [Burkholderia sp. WP9]
MPLVLEKGFAEDRLIAEIVAEEGMFIEIRRRLHANPELGADVDETADFVAGLLRDWGYSVYTGIGGMGVVAQLKLGTSKRTIGIRADMDALPIFEQTGLPYASRTPGKMHACGHDGHTAILLAAAKHIARSRSFNGTLNLIFQPDEENLGGARRMIEDGLFKRFPCDAVYALHNGPGIPVGQFVVKDGDMLAGSDIATIKLTGVGGHGAMPDKTRDPIVAAGSLIMALQTIVARNLAATDTGVVSIGAIHAGATHNVIPESVELMLNIRSTSPEIRERIEARVRGIVEAQAQCFGVEASIHYKQLVPVVMNAESPTALARGVASAIVGPENVLHDTKSVLASEDFAWMAQAVPGSYVFIGNGVGQWGGCMCHNPKYDFNDRIISLGATYWVKVVETYLQ